MNRIQILDDHLVNRIAAGEVVERPASVVKELVENALDADSTHIDIELETGGRRLVRVCDDGTGMDEDEALLALERHATSKIRDVSELERISTLGFRGEALPSIAAVSRMRLSSALDPAHGGCVISVEGGRILGVEPMARSRGTSIEVRDLFFNTPARRKFLHAPETELRHVQEALIAMAMARPEVGFRFRHGSRVLIEAPSTYKIEQRLRDLLGRKKVGSIHHFEAVGGASRVWGLLAETQNSGRPRVSLLVNGRWVRDRLMVAAVFRVLRAAGQGFAGAHIILALSLPPEAVDVNVHPAKAEVRFAHSGAVFALIERALRRLLEAGHSSVPVRKFGVVSESSASVRSPASEWAANVSPISNPVSGEKPDMAQPSLFQHPAYGFGSDPEENGEAVFAGPSSHPSTRSGAKPGPADTPFGRLLAQYRNSFLLLEDEYGLLIVDQHVAHERILFEKILARLESRSSPSQALLMPVVLELDEARVAALPRVDEILAAVGVEAEIFGPATIRLTALPPELDREEAGAFLEEILDRATEIDGTPERGAEQLREETAASMSCRAAIKVNCPLKEAEQRALLADLAKTRDPYRCPHGRPIVLRLGQDEMERRLGRR